MFKQFLRQTPQAASIVIGLACAGLFLEALRTPAIRDVTFEVFHPLPYLAEGIALVALAFLMHRGSPSTRLANHPVIAIATATTASLSLFLIVQSEGALPGNFSQQTATALYRISSSFLFVLWAERLFDLGAKRAACAYALSLVANAALLVLLSFCSFTVGQAILTSLPVISMGLLITLRPAAREEDTEESEAVHNGQNLDNTIPPLRVKTKRDVTVAAILFSSPILMRAPFISVQSSWIPQQSAGFASLLLQLSMAAGLLLGCALLAMLVRYLWNKHCIMFFELLIVPLSLLAFYAAQASEALWFIYVPIIDATYRATLLFVILTPFLFSARRPFSLMPFGFGILILGRALFSFFVSVMPPSLYAGVSVTFVTLGILGSVAALMASGMLDDAPENASTPSDAPASPATPAITHACDVLAAQCKLTAREREVLELLAHHYNAPYIAKKLVLSTSTVKTHMRNLYAKLGVHSQSDLYLLVEQTMTAESEESHDC